MRAPRRNGVLGRAASCRQQMFPALRSYCSLIGRKDWRKKKAARPACSKPFIWIWSIRSETLQYLTTSWQCIKCHHPSNNQIVFVFINTPINCSNCESGQTGWLWSHVSSCPGVGAHVCLLLLLLRFFCSPFSAPPPWLLRRTHWLPLELLPPECDAFETHSSAG